MPRPRLLLGLLLSAQVLTACPTSTWEAIDASSNNLHRAHAVAVARVAVACAPKVAQRAARRAVAHPEAIQGMGEPKARPASFYRGVTLGLFAAGAPLEEQKKIYSEMLDEIQALGASDVGLVMRWAQTDIRSHDLKPRGKLTVKTELMRWAVGAIKQRKMRVFLLPIIHLERRKKGEWRGKMAPTDEDAWWAAYERYILHAAKLSQETGVDLLSVGSELLSLERKRERWLKLIAAVRAVYKGKLTYSSNWDHFEAVRFWDKVDVVGMTAYQELSAKPNPTLKELVAGWQGFRQRIEVWMHVEGVRQFMFTEIGYPSHSRGARYPWDYRPQGQPDPDLQARCFRAVYEVWQDDERLAGLFIWNWFGYRRPGDRGYTPRGKPSESVLGHWFRGSYAETP